MGPRSGSIGQGLPNLFKLEEPGALHNAPGHAMAIGGAQRGNSLTSGYPCTGLPKAAASHYGTDNMGPVTEAGTGFQGSGSEATGRGRALFRLFPLPTGLTRGFWESKPIRHVASLSALAVGDLFRRQAFGSGALA